MAHAPSNASVAAPTYSVAAPMLLGDYTSYSPMNPTSPSPACRHPVPAHQDTGPDLVAREPMVTNTMYQSSVNHLLPTPPTQIHDAFSNHTDKVASQVDQEKPLHFPPSPGTPSQRKRTFSETVEKEGDQRSQVPCEDFELYSDDGERRKLGDSTKQQISKDTSMEARQKAYEARHPVYTPVMWFNEDRRGLLRFLNAERKHCKEMKELERAKVEARKQNAAPKKAARSSALAAAKQRSVKRRRIADEDEEAPTAPTTRSATRSPKAADLPLAEDAPVSRPDTAALGTTEREVVSIKAQATRAESKESSRVAKPTSAKPTGTIKIKPVGKAKPVKPTAQPKKPIKKGKEGTMTEHSTAIKEALKQRMQNHGNSKDKGAYHLYNDAYLPSGSIDGKELPKPSRDNMPPSKALNPNDQYFSDLHPLERQLAERIRLTPIEYLTQKSRYFLGTGEWFRLGHEKLNKAHAQVFCNQDGNNTSEMHQVYEAWGWNEPTNWSDDVLKALKPLTDCKQHTAIKK